MDILLGQYGITEDTMTGEHVAWVINSFKAKYGEEG
jgi:hypothetical protein